MRISNGRMGYLNSWFAVLLVTRFALTTQGAWVSRPSVSSVTRKKSSMALNLEATETSRREWLGGMASAAFAAALGLTSTVANPEPVSAVSSSTAAVATAATCDPSVSIWTNPSNGRKVYLLGTAHISSASAELAGKIVEDVEPEAVFIELDAKRVGGRAVIRQEGSPIADTEALIGTASSSKEQKRNRGLALGGNDDNSGSSDRLELIATTPPAEEEQSSKERKDNNPLRNAILGIGSKAVDKALTGMYRNVGKAGFEPGAEFVNAVHAGQKIGSKIVLGDRDVDVTLRRLTEAIATTDINKMIEEEMDMEETMKGMLPSSSPIVAGAELDKESMTVLMETMKEKDNLKKLIGSMKKSAPNIYNALVAERDQYMANGLDQLNMFPSIVAVMGIAHIDGVEKNLSSRGWKPAKLACGLKRRR